MGGRLLTVNTGSSSLKTAIYEIAGDPVRYASFDVSRIGTERGLVHVTGGVPASTNSRPVPDHAEALTLLTEWLRESGFDRELLGVGHRVVHGGPHFSAPAAVSDALVAELKRLVPIDPMHLPQAIEAIERLRTELPGALHVACFDTAFHRTMPPVASTYPLPADLRNANIIRYGFHGLSYEYIVSRMRQVDPTAASGRVVIAHLGNGASMAAVRDGRGIDTTMGFTPTGGLVMGTRTGDLDPGVLLYLLQERGMSAQDANDLVNDRSGLLGLSGTTSDMQDLLERRDHDEAAALAIDVFCYSARKFVASMATALGGLDTLIFTGGIGEHAVQVRLEICRGLHFLGIEVDEARNMAGEEVVSSNGSRVSIRVMKTDEDSMIAAHTLRLLTARGDTDVPI